MAPDNDNVGLAKIDAMSTREEGGRSLLAI